MLDLVFSRYPRSVSDVSVCAPLAKSDHAVLKFVMHTTFSTPTTTSLPRRVFSAINLEILTEASALLDWRSLMTLSSVDELWSSLKAYVIWLTDQAVPVGLLKKNTSPG
ncbi:Hypothetical predicted protein [Octopus vulgaris]|uniref:Uncharacterized protein n=1 Tax=Octopus vulgaris TaxID=6645 RepID=A0AA36BVK9_OCTVU|nr:Hypothetical predicted protein [Octopus vulgaris]